MSSSLNGHGERPVGLPAQRRPRDEDEAELGPLGPLDGGDQLHGGLRADGGDEGRGGQKQDLAHHCLALRSLLRTISAV